MNLLSVEAAQEGDRPRLPFRERRIFSPSPRRASETLTLLSFPRVPAPHDEDVDVFAPRRSRERIRMKCGTKITPCGGTPLGVASAKRTRA